MSSCARFSASDFDTSSEFRQRKVVNQDVEQKPVPIDFLNQTWQWGVDLMSPVERAMFEMPPKEGYKTRVKRWLRQIAKAEGHKVPEDENLEDQQPSLEKRGWGYVPVGDWGDSAPLLPDPDAKNMVDPKLLANFRFVEKTARRRKLSEWESRRLHIVFRASTEEKINRIQQLIRVLLPFVEEELRMTRSSRSRSP